jgi:hypothetical protein
MKALETYSTNNGRLATLYSMPALICSYFFSFSCISCLAIAIEICLFFFSPAEVLTSAGEHLTLCYSRVCL